MDPPGRAAENQKGFGGLRIDKQVTPAELAHSAWPKKVCWRAGALRLGDQVAKGYLQEDFIDTFRRYIPKSEVDALKTEMLEGLKTKGIKPPEEEPPAPGTSPINPTIH